MANECEFMTHCTDAPDARTRKAKACLPFFEVIPSVPVCVNVSVRRVSRSSLPTILSLRLFSANFDHELSSTEDQTTSATRITSFETRYIHTDL